MTNEFNNPMSFQTIARTPNGTYFMNLAEWRDLDKSIETAKEFAAKPKYQRKGYFAQVLSSKGQLLFDSRTASASR